MRSSVAVLLLLLTAGCSSGDPAAEPAPGAPASSPTTSSSPSPSGSPDPGAADPASTPACAAVRAGIDAFNAGDYGATVEHFVEAVPLAEDQLDGSAAADDLLEAVRWYARLPPENYLAASASSPDFARYKAITLGQCVTPEDQPTESPGVSV